MIDLSLLRCLRTRTDYDIFRSSVPLNALEPRTKTLVEDIDKYYVEFKEHTSIDFILFKDRFFSYWHRDLDADQTSFYNKTLDRVDVEVDHNTKAILINSLVELKYATDAANLLSQYNAGDEISIVNVMQELTDNAVNRLQQRERREYQEPDFASLLLQDADDSGLKWANASLNAAIRPLRGGDFIIAAGRPDTGKTSFIAHQATNMATQCDEDRCILWLSNEGTRDSIVKRSLNAAIGVSTRELVELQQSGDLKEMYESAIGGAGRLQIEEIVGWTDLEVKDLIEQVNPQLVIMDMIDKINFIGMKRDGRTDEILEAQYSSFREHGIKNDYATIATSQISGDGHGLEFPEMHMLKDSKTGKQGACDVILMIGKSDDPMKDNYRYLSTPKNKLARENCKDPRCTTLFNGNTSRYTDVQS